jgi:formate hydrogenlyase subunit 4
VSLTVLNLAALVVLPWLMSGLIQRIKSRWSGRRGPSLWQSAYDVARLLRKSSVYGATTTPLFRIAPWVYLITTLGAAAVIPLAGLGPITSFPFDYVWLAYAYALGRVAMMLAALDTGSSFEGMGAAREATFAALLEPVLFLVVGGLSMSSAGTHAFHEALVLPLGEGARSFVMGAAASLALLIVLSVETARMPVDDPTTHLELTMVHEVQVLDHSGPDLAAIQTGSAIKLLVGSSMIATLLNPWAGAASAQSVVAHLVLLGLVALLIGTIESLTARLPLRAVPAYILLALGSGACVVLVAWERGP